MTYNLQLELCPIPTIFNQLPCLTGSRNDAALEGLRMTTQVDWLLDQVFAVKVFQKQRKLPDSRI